MFFDDDESEEFDDIPEFSENSKLQTENVNGPLKEWLYSGMEKCNQYQILSNIQILNAIKRFSNIDINDPDAIKRLKQNPQLFDMYNRVFFTLHCMGFRRPNNKLTNEDLIKINTLIQEYSNFIFKNNLN